MGFDLETIKQALELAGSSIQSVGALADIADRVKSFLKSPQPRTDAEIERLIAELTSQVAKAQFTNAQLHVHLTTLLLAMQKANEAQAKLARYELRRTPGGDLVYALRESERGSEPEHFACPKCYENGLRALLQPYSHDGAAVGCQSCRSTYWIAPKPA